MSAILQDKPDDRETATLVARLIELADVPFGQRRRAAELAGRVGDPRFPVMLDEWRAAIAGAVGEPVRAQHAAPLQHYFCRVDAGSYHIGGRNEGKKSADITLPGFWIARYPITVAQYRTLIEAGGYTPIAQRWWTPNGWKWKGNRAQPGRWNESPWDGPNQPVIDISWYEAVAFASWLIDQLKNALLQDFIIRLPSEAEWEVAAMWDAQREQMRTWQPLDGEIWQNVKETGIGRPAPVGLFPQGASPCGALDMAGNVWEWCSSPSADYPAEAITLRDDFMSNWFGPPLRGGDYSLQNIRAGWNARLRDLPGNQSGDGGFRVCALVAHRK